MKPVIFTLVGKDKAGLVDSLAKIVYSQGGNWLGSNISHMAGHFAGFVQIDLPEDKQDAIMLAFANHPDLTIHLMAGEVKEPTLQTRIGVEVTGNDKPGIVQELTSVFNQFNLNISKFESSCRSAPNWGSLLFKARAEIDVADGFELDNLRSALENIADDLMVDIHRIE